MRLSIPFFALSALAFATACQTAGQTVKTETSPVCPTCKTATKTAAIKGLTYTKHVCPQCRTVYDPSYDESGRSVEVHVCDHCRQIVEKCPLCAKQ